jgi:hypothetical protein
MTVVLQINSPGYYVSELIKNRFQVMESTLTREFFVWDSTMQNNLRARDGSILYFKTQKDAKNHISKNKF